jgi:hypothetical protein
MDICATVSFTINNIIDSTWLPPALGAGRWRHVEAATSVSNYLITSQFKQEALNISDKKSSVCEWFK